MDDAVDTQRSGLKLWEPIALEGVVSGEGESRRRVGGSAKVAFVAIMARAVRKVRRGGSGFEQFLGDFVGNVLKYVLAGACKCNERIVDYASLKRRPEVFTRTNERHVALELDAHLLVVLKGAALMVRRAGVYVECQRSGVAASDKGKTQLFASCRRSGDA